MRAGRTSIWLARHGQTLANRERRYLGRGDSPLTPWGTAQTARLARRLRPHPFDVVVSSPSLRALTLAQQVVQARTAMLQHDPAWAEVAHGTWEGLTWRDVLARHGAAAHARFAEPWHGRATGGESLAEVHRRVFDAWHALLTTWAGGKVLVTSHATPIQLVLCIVSGMPPHEPWRWRIDLGSLTIIDVYPAGPIVRQVNEVARGSMGVTPADERDSAERYHDG